MPSQNDIRQNVTNQLLEALESGVTPWRRPWASDKNAGSSRNAVSNRSYSGVNPLLLSVAAEKHDLKSRYWATYKQWQALGGQVKRSNVAAGKWGTQIIFCKPCTKKSRDDSGQENEDKFWMLRTYTVINIDQVEGTAVDRFRVGHHKTEPSEIDDRYRQGDELIEATGANIVYGGNRAFYKPQGDYIQLPHRQQFSASEFFDTAFHELAHWTEHPSRLNWDRSKPENTYALGELIAELASCYVVGELGLPLDQSLGNHAAYLGSWIEQMKGDSRFIFKATSQASKSADYLLSFRHQPATVEEREPAIIV